MKRCFEYLNFVLDLEATKIDSIAENGRQSEVWILSERCRP
jgi:hypothetical protein